MRLLNACMLCICASVASSAAAQVDVPPAKERPATSAAAAQQPPLDATATNVPEVNDPMLEPVETPPQVLGSWRQAVTLTQSRSTSVATARARILEANSQSRLALSSALPEITGSGSVRHVLYGQGSNVAGLPANVRLAIPATVWNAGVSLRQPLLDLRAWHDMGTSSSALQAAKVSAQDTQRQALGALADTIVTVFTAERLSEVSRVSLRSNLSTLDLTQRRMRLGAASSVDVLRADQEVALTRSDVVQTDESVRRAREALGLALGYSEAWGVASNIKVDELAADAQSVCSRISDPEQRSDVRAARLNVEVSERNVASVAYGHAPTVDFVSDFDYSTQSQSGRPVQWSIGAVLSIPIYDAGRLSAERGVNQANADIARQQLTEATRRARLEAVQAQRSIQVAEANFGVSRQARDIAAESARLSRIAFVHGTGTSFDLVESARRQRESEIDVTVKEFEVVRARISALLALSNCNL
jgi:outer membrane protein, multidrug efflux system